MNATRTLIFWSYVPEFWSKIIVRITGNKLSDKSDHFSHMGILFELEDCSFEYYEALFGKGFIGPKPFDKLKQKVADSHGDLCWLDTCLKSPESELIRQRCKRWVGTRGYFGWQLILMWWFERIGRHLGWHVPRSPIRVVCSEAVARLVWPFFDLRDPEHNGFDEVNPNSAYRRWRAIEQTMEEEI